MVRTAWRLGLAAMLLLATASAVCADVRVRLTPVEGGVEARFHLDAPRPRFEFFMHADVVRQDGWRVTTDGMALKAGVVSRADGTPLQDFTVKIIADTAPRDRTYPGLTKVGAGWQLYGPYLEGKGEETRVDLALPKDWTSAPAKAREIDPQGYLYLGPKAYVTAGPAAVVVPPEIPAVLRQTAVAAADRAMKVYAQKLGQGLAFKPTIVMALAPSFSPGWQGDTTDGAMVSLRFFGSHWDTPTKAQIADTSRFVFHEFFHLWNSRTAHSRDGDEEAWLHEGMAEYAALITAAAEDPAEEATVWKELGERLSRCANKLKRGLKLDPPRSGNAVYDCGVVAEWAADLNARAKGQDVWAIWKAMIAPNAKGEREYDAARFEALAATTAADDPVKRLIEGPADWDAIIAALNARGAEIVASRNANNDRAALLWHLERQVCVGGSVGFYSEPDNLKLDTGDHCGPLNGDPHVDSVAGINVVTEPGRAFDAVVPLCAASKPV